MPIGSPTAGFDVGHDVTVNVIDPTTNTIITLGNLTDFDSQQMTKQIESSPLSSPPLFGEIPHGWSGSLTVDRSSASADDFIARVEALYWNTGSNLLYGSITEYLQELSGTVSQYRYTNVVFHMADAGKKVSQGKITMKINWRSSLRVKVV